MDGNANGLPSLWNTWRDTYRTETSEGRMEELRPLNFGKRTSEINIRSLGGAPYSAPAPIQSLNSEWGRIECDGVERGRAPAEASAARASEGTSSASARARTLTRPPRAARVLLAAP